MTRVTDDELVLHYYGELAQADDARLKQALQSDAELNDRYSRLSSVLASISEASAVQTGSDVESRVLDRLDSWTAERTGSLPTDPTMLNDGATFIALRALDGNSDAGTSAEADATNAPVRQVPSDQQTALNDGATLIVGPDDANPIGGDPTAGDGELSQKTGAVGTPAADGAGDFAFAAPGETAVNANDRTFISGIDDAAVVDASLPDVPGYEIMGELGRGGMGVVYRAKQSGLNRVVALKMIRGGGDSAKQETLRRFKAEAEAVAQLQHPNIVQIYDVGNHSGNPFFSLEFVDGMPLDEKLEGKPMKAREAAELAVTLARAMKYAHDRGIIHRDLKPGNVLLSHDGVAKVTDFGLVKRVEDDSSQTRDGAVVGTPAYMAPEQAWGKSDLGPLADIYGLGAMLYAFLTGRPPFVSATPIDTVLKVREEEAVPPRKLLPEIPADLETIVMKCLQKQPDKRYSDGDELADDLERFLEGRPITARPVGRTERLYRWCKRNPKYAALTGTVAALLLTIMGGGYVLAGQADSERAIAMEQKGEAQRQKTEADTQRTIAETQKEEANKQRAIAEEQAKIANDQSELATDTMRAVIYDVHNELEKRPSLQALRERVLNQAMSRVGKTLDANAATARYDSSKMLLASSHRKIGNLCIEMGFMERAEKHLNTSLTIATEMHSRERLIQPDMNLGHVHKDLGMVAKLTGRVVEAKQYFTTAVDHLKNWLAEQPENAQRQLELANGFYQLGTVANMAGDLESARARFEESMQINQTIFRKNPNDQAAQQRLAGSYGTLSSIHFGKGEIKEAVDYAKKSLQKFEELHEQNPSHVGQWNVARKRLQVGKQSLNAGDPASASEFLAKAFDEFRELRLKDEDNSRLYADVGQAEYALGVALTKIGEEEKANEHFENTITIRRELLAKAESNLEARAQLVLSLARAGQLKEALEHADAISAVDAGQYMPIYAACGYCLAADMTEDPERREMLMQKAIDQIRIGIEKGYRDFETLRRDFDFDPLKTRDDYIKLLADSESGKA